MDAHSWWTQETVLFTFSFINKHLFQGSFIHSASFAVPWTGSIGVECHLFVFKFHSFVLQCTQLTTARDLLYCIKSVFTRDRRTITFPKCTAFHTASFTHCNPCHDCICIAFHTSSEQTSFLYIPVVNHSQSPSLITVHIFRTILSITLAIPSFVV